MNYLQHRQNLKLNGKPAPVKKVYVIAKRSAKKIAEQKVYLMIVKEMMAESNLCELKVEGVCNNIATGLHHMRKRVGFMFDRRYLKRSCNPCNEYAEMFPKKAIELGISISKFG